MSGFLKALLAIVVLICGFLIYAEFTAPIGIPNSEAIDTWPDTYQDTTSVNPISIRLKKGDLLLKPKASYDISAKILSKRLYFKNWDGKISPYDLALGWGGLTDDKLKKTIKYNQWGRFYFFKYDYDSPYDMDYISKHSSNCHIIPANNNLRNVLKRLKKNQLVRLKGYLVYVDGTYKGYPVHWHSSLTRTDTGDGACEIIYVTEIITQKKVYK